MTTETSSGSSLRDVSWTKEGVQVNTIKINNSYFQMKIEVHLVNKKSKC